MAENRRAGGQNGNSFYRVANMQLTKKLSKYITQYAPDAIIYTHPFLGVVTDLMKTRNDIQIPMIGVVTDYTVHPLWEEARSTDKIVIANDLLRSQLLRKGIREDQIAPIGIPIRQAFSEKIPKERARALLGLDNKFTLLLMGGSMGHADHVKNIESLSQIGTPFQFLVVCGNNKKMLYHVEQFAAHYQGSCRIYPYGFVHNVEVMMSASDCIVSKPGGLTVSEALAKNLPMLLFDPIPGHEERNVDFLVNNGMAALITKHFPIDEAVYELFCNPVRLETVRRTMSEIAHPDATERLAEFVLRKR